MGTFIRNPKYSSDTQDPRYQELVRRWIRGLRHEDGREANDAAHRQHMLGSLATGGKAGLSAGTPPIPPAEDDGHYPERKP